MHSKSFATNLFVDRIAFISWCLLITTSFGVASFSFPAQARTWYIKADGTGDAPTIQAGVDSATVGDTVLVAAGVYSDTRQILVGGEPKTVNVHLYKDVRLLAEGPATTTTIDGSISDIGVYIENTSHDSEVHGFNISTEFRPYLCVDNLANDAVQPPLKIAIQCGYSSVAITGNEIVDNGIAVRLENSPATIADNVINHSFFGIECVDTSDADVVGNAISDCATLIDCYRSSPQIRLNDISVGCDGITCRLGSAAVISENNIHEIDVHGVAILSSSPHLQDNTFSGNQTGVAVQDHCDGLIIRRNLFYSHRSSAIDFLAVPNAIIEHNTIDSVEYWAISLQGSHPTISNNIITRASAGIRCLGGSSPSFECNDLYAVDFPYIGDCPNQTGLNGNISLDPEYCGVDDSGNYYLQSDSPCAAGNHPTGYSCGVIGRYDVSCGIVDIRRSTWGGIKNKFLKEESHE